MSYTKEELELYEFAYLRGRDAHQKRILKFIYEVFDACQDDNFMESGAVELCRACKSANIWHDRIKKEFDREARIWRKI